MSHRVERVIVAGAGIAGLSAAIALRRNGITVEILESAPELRASGTGIGLACNALAVLDRLEVDLVGAGLGRAMERFVLRTADGRPIRSVDYLDIAGELGYPLVNIHRRQLLSALRAATAETPIRFGAEVKGFDVETSGRVRVTCADGYTTTGDALIGADGIHSAVRAQLTGPAPVTDHGYVCWLATTEFAHPSLGAGHATHYWGTGKRFGLADIGAGQLYWWATCNEASRDAGAGGKDEVRECFHGWAPEIGAIIDRTPAEAIVTVPAQDRPFLESWGAGPVSLTGDAAHPMLTSLSQGGSSAIEDAWVLAHHLSGAPDAGAGLRAYENARRERARTLVTGSRRLSRVEQLAHPVAVRLRELAFRHAPDRLIRTQTIEPMRFPLPS